MKTSLHIDVYKLLLQGFRLYPICRGDTIEKITAYFPVISEQMGDKNGGYIFCDIFRFRYNAENLIEEIGIYFPGSDEIELPVVLYNEVHTISNKMLLHQFIYILNNFSIKWSAEGGKPGHGVILSINAGTNYAIFDAEGYLRNLVLR